jgi:cyclopropane fatty-acyl-phospholipid synthase-like methyltransferase
MDFEHPPLLFGSLYRGCAGTIELAGDEDLLEFGCGSGGITEWLAPG